MKRALAAAGVIAVAAMSLAVAQSGSQQKSLAATMDVYVFPTEGQTAEQQSMDEAECYNWAVGQTGNDPFDLNKQAQQQAQQSQQAEQQAKKVGQGSGATGAVGGAAAGALVGAIAGDTGKGAAYGAAAGLIAGRRRGAQAQQQATQQAQKQGQQAQQATADQIENFKKAFAVCLEAKDYMAKF
jgi:hypothetical protein